MYGLRQARGQALERRDGTLCQEGKSIEQIESSTEKELGGEWRHRGMEKLESDVDFGLRLSARVSQSRCSLGQDNYIVTTRPFVCLLFVELFVLFEVVKSAHLHLQWSGIPVGSFVLRGVLRLTLCSSSTSQSTRKPLEY